jgi:hypothetical protein
MIQTLTFLEELFLSTDVYGLLGPLALIIIGVLAMKKDKVLFIPLFMVDAIFAYTYWELISTNGFYVWHAMIMTVGLLFTLVFPAWNS